MNETPSAPSEETTVETSESTGLKKNNLLKLNKGWQSYSILAFIVIFVGFGAYVVISSFAATDTATKTWSTASDWAAGTLSSTAINGNSVVLASTSTKSSGGVSA